MWENADGERVWVKYHFKTGQGIQNFTDAEAKAMSAEDPDYHRRDLRESIRRGDHPVWRLEMQIMPFKDAATYRFNPFDLYRIGTNYEQLPVNRPVVEVHNYNKDGAMRYEHSDDQPPYAPNSYGGPKADSQRYGGVVATGGPRARPAHRPGPRRGLASSRCRPLTTVVEDAGNRA
jgi:catalase